MSYLTRIINIGKKKELENFDYDIQCYTPSDYNLTIQLKADSKLIGLIWAKSKAAAMERKGIDVRSHEYAEIKQFDIPQVYFNFLKITIQSLIGNCSEIFKKDGIILLNYEVKGATFKVNESKGWDIIIKTGGIYTRKQP